MIMSESHRRATSKCEDKLMCICVYMYICIYVILCYIFFMLYIYIDTKRSEEAEADSQKSLIPIYFLLDTEKPLKDELGDTV